MPEPGNQDRNTIPGGPKEPGRGGVIKIYGNPILKKQCPKVPEVDREIRRLIEFMAKVMYSNRGIGLAAPQVGVLARVIVADAGEGLVALVNPKIVSRKGSAVMEEGCLSVPGIHLEIKRPQEVSMEGLNAKGEKVRLECGGLIGRVLQHELDHLDGILIVDRVSKKRLKTLKNELELLSKNA
jgi:peptide deformylase